MGHNLMGWAGTMTGTRTEEREQTAMNRDLSPDEQREFWAEFFAVVIRYEARKRRELEVALELLEDVRQTEPSQI
jgi:hypothetical protein